MDKNLLRHAALLHPHEIMPPYDEIMKIHGFDAVYEFVDLFGGCTIYVPYARKIFSGCLEEEARREYNGHNMHQLSKKYGFSERWLRDALR